MAWTLQCMHSHRCARSTLLPLRLSTLPLLGAVSRWIPVPQGRLCSTGTGDWERPRSLKRHPSQGEQSRPLTCWSLPGSPGSTSAADNWIRWQNGADKHPEGPCLGTGAPWPGERAATVNTLNQCLWRGICMCVRPTVRRSQWEMLVGEVHTATAARSPRPRNTVSLAVRCRALGPHKKPRGDHCSLLG